jgi:hypothetical protein
MNLRLDSREVLQRIDIPEREEVRKVERNTMVHVDLSSNEFPQLRQELWISFVEIRACQPAKLPFRLCAQSLSRERLQPAIEGLQFDSLGRPPEVDPVFWTSPLFGFPADSTVGARHDAEKSEAV